jgi:hypothetical protein
VATCCECSDEPSGSCATELVRISSVYTSKAKKATYFIGLLVGKGKVVHEDLSQH